MRIRMLKDSSNNKAGDIYDTTLNWITITNRQAIEYGIAEEVKEPEYKPYEKVDTDWLGSEVESRLYGSVHLITDIYPPNRIEAQSQIHTLEEMFDKYIWYKGSIFGDKI